MARKDLGQDLKSIKTFLSTTRIECAFQRCGERNVRVLLIEYVTAMYGCRNLYEDLLPEGASMALMALRVLKPYCDVSLAASRVLRLGDVDVVSVDCSDPEASVRELASLYDYVILVAPPRELVRLFNALSSKIPVPASVVATLSDKYSAYEVTKRCEIETPKTFLVSGVAEVRDLLKMGELELPIVVKPTMLAGSECVYVVNDSDTLEETVEAVRKCDPLRRAVIQEYVEGVHGSVSAVVGGGEVYFYSFNLQLVDLEDVGGAKAVRYLGNVTPVRGLRFSEEALRLVSRFSSCFPEYRGYVGFDVVASSGSLKVVEVNPRLTTSFIAIAELYPEIGRLLIESLSGSKPKGVVHLGDSVDGTAFVVVADEDTIRGLGCRTVFSHRGRAVGVGMKSTGDAFALADELKKVLKSFGGRGTGLREDG